MKSNLSPWLLNGEDTSVEMSSRIRLARNIIHLPFPHQLKDDSVMEDIINRLEQTLSDFTRYDMRDLSYEDKYVMVEKHLISPVFIQKGLTCFINDNESIAVMVNEEDHIRIQAMGSNQNLHEIYQTANEIDETIESVIEYAFDDQYGYLTACPTNVGTGLRASVMLHLPGLSTSGHLQRYAGSLNRFGFTIRGIYGEGTASLGFIYQLSNQMTLGQTEEEIIDHLIELKGRLIEEELTVRNQFLQAHEMETKDIVFRALGTLRYAYSISLKEAARALSDVKTGVDLGLITLESFHFQELIQRIQPAFIRIHIDEDLNVKNIDKKINEQRATLLRKWLGDE